LNHLTWVRAVRVDGRDVLSELVAEHGEAIAEQSGHPPALIEELGVIPSYYLRYFYAHDEVLAEQLDGVPRAVTVAVVERELLGLVQHVAAYERLTAEAAVTGDVGLARKALLAHPLIGQHALVDQLAEQLLTEARAAR